MTATKTATKIPTTYSEVRLSDQIDGDIVIGKRHSNGLVILKWASTLGWGPWQPATTPVSVWR